MELEYCIVINTLLHCQLSRDFPETRSTIIVSAN